MAPSRSLRSPVFDVTQEDLLSPFVPATTMFTELTREELGRLWGFLMTGIFQMPEPSGTKADHGTILWEVATEMDRRGDDD